MRFAVFFLGLACCVGCGAAAQTPPAGPLAPAATAPVKKAIASKNRKSVRTTRRAVPPSYDAQDRFSPVATPTLSRSPDTSSDPVSFGMKWNGNNASARETRVQNYNGDAQGTGAELGMKLHF